tara:strand:- start:199 stop:453 length:255 start_codon:yes stop_codon:yes gene_type:complete
MNIIRKKCREADILAARFYKSAAGDRQRVARDWLNKVKEASELVNQLQKCRKHSASNKGYFTVTSKNVENVEANVEAGTVGIID